MPKQPTWTQDDMNDAYNLVINKTLTLSEASKLYKIPKSSLSDRVRGRTPLETTIGNKTYLSSKLKVYTAREEKCQVSLRTISEVKVSMGMLSFAI